MTGSVSHRCSSYASRVARSAACLAVIGLLAGSARAETKPAAASQPGPIDPPQGVFSDDWYAVRLMGERAGHMHSVMKRKGDVISAQVDTVLKISRGGMAISISMKQSSDEKLTGEPIRFDHEMSLAFATMRYRGAIKDGKLTLVSEQFGTPITRTYGFDPRSKFAWGAYLEELQHGLAEGTTYTTYLYDPTLRPDAPMPVEVRVGGKEMIDLFGRKTEAVRIVQDMKLPVGGMLGGLPGLPGGGEKTTSEAPAAPGLTVTTDVWVDAEGVPLLLRTEMMNLPLEMIKCPKAYAVEDVEPPELFVGSLIAVDKPIDRDGARKVTYRLSMSKGEGQLPTLPSTGMQKVLDQDADGVTLVVTRQDHKALASAKPEKPPKELAPLLEPSLFLNFKDDEVRRMAKAAAGGETRPYKLADKLRVYVTENIVEKNLNIGFATASEVARSREGDCTEHAVLLAALARANGLPARTVSGNIFVESFVGRRNVFGYHLWTQVYIGGQWVDLDAAQHQTDCDPTHIALNIMPLNDEGLADTALSLLNVIGRLKIDVRKVE